MSRTFSSCCARELGERVRAADELVQVVDRDLLVGADRDDLLGEHVERVARDRRLLDRALAHRLRDDRALEQVGAELREDPPLRDVAPSSCPARPTRWRPRATDFGLSTWITRSTAPMSMPSSRLEVATRHGMRPALSSSSISDALLARERAVVGARDLAPRRAR